VNLWLNKGWTFYVAIFVCKFVPWINVMFELEYLFLSFKMGTVWELIFL